MQPIAAPKSSSGICLSLQATEPGSSLAGSAFDLWTTSEARAPECRGFAGAQVAVSLLSWWMTSSSLASSNGQPIQGLKYTSLATWAAGQKRGFERRAWTSAEHSGTISLFSCRGGKPKPRYLIDRAALPESESGAISLSEVNRVPSLSAYREPVHSDRFDPANKTQPEGSALLATTVELSAACAGCLKRLEAAVGIRDGGRPQRCG